MGDVRRRDRQVSASASQKTWVVLVFATSHVINYPSHNSILPPSVFTWGR